MRPIVAVVLAAGRGTRLRSEQPKVLHEAAGRPLLAWVLEAARGGGCERAVVVVGHGADVVWSAPIEPGIPVDWVVQEEQLGTGHALLRAATAIVGEALVVVLSGDAPLVTAGTVARLVAAAERGFGALAVAELEDPGSLGRVLVDERGRLSAIVEAADATPALLAVRQVNAGFYALPLPRFRPFLDQLRPDNAGRELYLTDAVVTASAGLPIEIVTLEDPLEAQGVNTRRELAIVHRHLIHRTCSALLEAGVTLLDPERTVVEPGVEVGRDTVVAGGVYLGGRTRVGRGCRLEQGAWLRDATVGHGVRIGPNAVLDGVAVGDGAEVAAGTVHLGEGS